MEHYQFYTCYTPNTRGGIHADVVKFFPRHLFIPGFSVTEQATMASKELIHIIKNTGPQTPFTIGESQLHVINRLKKYLTPCNLRKLRPKVVPRESPKIAPTRVAITVPPPRVPETVTPPRVIKHR